MENTGRKASIGGFVDVSDYGRPVAVWIAGKLAPTRVRAYQVTLSHFLVMLLAVAFLAAGGLLNSVAAAGLLLVKNILDGADGSLARMQNRPSHVGRFLDTNLDFVGNFLLFLFLPGSPLWLRLGGFLAFLIQGSVFNYYYILLRIHANGEATSRIKECADTEYSYDNKRLLKVLYRFYAIFYGWQDRLIDAIELRLIRKNRARPSPLWVSLLSVHGLGFQYVVISVLLVASWTDLLPLYFLVGMSGQLMVLLFCRKAMSGAKAGSEGASGVEDVKKTAVGA